MSRYTLWTLYTVGMFTGRVGFGSVSGFTKYNGFGFLLSFSGRFQNLIEYTETGFKFSVRNGWLRFRNRFETSRSRPVNIPSTHRTVHTGEYIRIHSVHEHTCIVYSLYRILQLDHVIIDDDYYITASLVTHVTCSAHT